MSVIHDVSRAIHILRLLRSGTVYLCFFFKILFNISNAMIMSTWRPKVYISNEIKYFHRVALLAQWQSTGLVNQGSGVRSSYRAARILLCKALLI